MEGLDRRGDGWLMVRGRKWGGFVTVGKFAQVNRWILERLIFCEFY